MTTDTKESQMPTPNTGVDTLCERLEAHEGEQFETTMCFNGVRREAAARIRGLTDRLEQAEARCAELERQNKNLKDGISARDHDHRAGLARVEARCARLEKALRDLIEWVDRNGGLGEYKGGPAFAMAKARAALDAAGGAK